MPIDEQSVAGVASGLASTEELTLQVADGVSPDPTNGASQTSQTATSPAGGADDAQGGSQDGGAAGALETVEAALDDEDLELTPEEQTALEELRDYLREEATKEVTETIIPKIQSTYDRQIASQNRRIEEMETQAADRERALLEQVREAKLNGLTDTEKAQLKETWAYEDRTRELDAREKNLTSYHTDLLREAYATEYAQFGLLADDLADFNSPEEMDAFVRDVQLEYYKQLAELRQQGVDPEAVIETQQAAPKAKVPAGVSAPSDAGGGAAVPSIKAFDKTPGGVSSIYGNLKDPDGWETVKVSH